VGKYELTRLLGKGAMGAVYLAHDPLLERDVAVKVMLPQIADDPEQKQRFEREARAVARMMHPNVVTVFDLGYHTDGSPYIVMELLKGQDLLQRMRNGGDLSLADKLSIVSQVLDGLGHAHRVGIIHRDIKPANVFIGEEGTAKIMDFGVARFTTGSATAAGVVLGTANYMSPEQVLGGNLDGRTDLFSVGCLLCEMLTGRRPFEADSALATLYKIAHEPPAIDLPDGSEAMSLRLVLSRALARDAKDRYATAADFKAAIRESQGGPVQDRAATVISSTGVDGARGTASASEATMEVLGRSPVRPDLGGREAMSAPTVEIARPRTDVTGLFRLLREIHVGAKSGHLHGTHGRERRGLRVLRGRILHGTSDVAGEHLGDVMVRYGLLSQPDLERAVAVVLATRQRLGPVLLELGLADEKRLEEAVGLHVREILVNAIGRAGGSFVFEELSESFLEDELTGDISTGALILEATRRVQDPELVRDGLGDKSRVLVLSSDPLLRTQKIALTPTDGFVLSRIDGTLGAQEIIGLSPLPPEDTERSLFGLLSTGMVDYRREATSRARPAAREAARPATPPVAPAIKAPTPEPPLPRAAEPEVNIPKSHVHASGTEELRRLILAASEGLRTRNHFEILGVTRSASDAEVKEAYLRFARLLHPDACRDEALADVREKRNVAFARLCEAYETLRDPSSRREYEARLGPVKRPSPAPPSTPAATASPTPRSGTAAPNAQASSASAPVAPPASAASKEPSPEAVVADAAAQAEATAAAIRSAERLQSADRTWDAIQVLEKAMPGANGTLRLRALVLLARLYMKNPKWLKRAEDILLKVVDEDPARAEAYVALGSLYKAGELGSRAAAMYKKALELEPGDREALAGQESLKTMKATGSSRSVLKNLFGKL
jgi:serine/threonine protein kinase/tetratricopeptide (TPR) repeat protein